MGAWESFWRSLRPTNGRVADEAIEQTGRAQSIAEEAADRIDDLVAELEWVRGRLAASESVAQGLADEMAEMRRDRNLARSLVAASPEEAKRVCLDLSDRNAELRAANERLEREVARLQGRSTDQDWTGSTTLATRPT